MRNILILAVLVLTTLSFCDKKTMAIIDSKNQYSKTVTLDSTKWRLKKIYHADSFVQVSNTNAFIYFNTSAGKTNGNGSCNSFGGKLSIDGNNLRFGNIYSTKMLCIEVQTIENEFFSQLQKVTGYKISEKKLILFHGDDALLEFEAG